jgi:2-isopropylmalate synthase
MAVYVLDHSACFDGNGYCPTATVRIRRGDEIFQDAACGDGPVDAALKTIDRITGIHGKLVDFALQAITTGKGCHGRSQCKGSSLRAVLF